MPVIGHRTLRLSDTRSACDVATHGQRMMWQFMGWMAPEVDYYNIVQGVDVPAGADLDTALAAIRTVVSRHEALRTRFRLDERGEPTQELLSPDELTVEICAIDATEDLTEITDTYERDLAATRFDHASAPPTRVVVATVDGVPLVVGLAMSHLAVDMLSARLVSVELAEAMAAPGLASPDAPAPPRPPMEQAGHERTPRGRRDAARAVAHWRHQLETAPRTMFAEPPGEPEEFRYRWGRLRSTAIARAADVLGRRYRASTSTVLLAATAVALGGLTGNPRCALRLNAANRVPAELRGGVGMLSQDVPAVIDVDGPCFADVVRDAWAASLRAYRHGNYPWPEVEELIRPICLRRGVELDLTCFFNDLRTDTTPSATAEDITVAELRRARAETTWTWERGCEREFMTFLARVGEDGDAVDLSFLVDTRYLPRPRARALVEGIEGLLIDAVASDGPLETMDTFAALAPPSRGEGWVLLDEGRVDLRAVERLVADAVRPSAVAVSVEPDSDGRRMPVARLTAPDASYRAPEDVHAACMALLPDRRTAIAPGYYIVHASAPARPADPEAWKSCPVRAEGTGRSVR